VGRARAKDETHFILSALSSLLSLLSLLQRQNLVVEDYTALSRTLTKATSSLSKSSMSHSTKSEIGALSLLVLAGARRAVLTRERNRWRIFLQTRPTKSYLTIPP